MPRGTISTKKAKSEDCGNSPQNALPERVSVAIARGDSGSRAGHDGGRVSSYLVAP